MWTGLTVVAPLLFHRQNRPPMLLTTPASLSYGPFLLRRRLRQMQNPLRCAAEIALVLLPYGYIPSATSSCLHLGRNRSCVPTPVEPTPPTPSPPAVLQFPVKASSDDLREVLSARGEVPRSMGAHHDMETPTTQRAVQVLINLASLARLQRGDSQLGQVHKSLCGSPGTGAGVVDATNYGLEDSDVIRYADEKGRKLPAIPESMVADVLALVRTLHGHAGVGATLSYVFDLSHWPSGYPRHATIRAIVRVPEAQEIEQRMCDSFAPMPARTVG